MKFRLLVLIPILFGNVVSGQATAEWRGPGRQGIYPEKNLLRTWPESGPPLIWSTDRIGTGYSSPVVTEDMVIINGEINREEHVFAFDLKGNLLWDYANGPVFTGAGYAAGFPGTRSAPTVADDLIYVCSGMGRIACLEAPTGKERWTVDMIAGLGGKLNMFGCSESLLVDETKVYCYPGGKETNVAALDRMTGKPVWISKALGDPVSFCSPVMINLPGLDIFVTLSYKYLIGINARTGELLWSHREDSVKIEGEHCNTPIFAEGSVYCISGDEGGNGAYKLQLSADGKSIHEIWRNRRVRNAIGGFVKIGNRIYTSSKDNKLKVLDTTTGMVVDSLRNMRGNIIAADSLLFFYSDNGYLHLIAGIGAKLNPAGKLKIILGTKEHFAHPVIRNGVLYLRHGDTLMAYLID
jgi:outer membrane protein assembly factor BamB